MISRGTFALLVVSLAVFTGCRSTDSQTARPANVISNSVIHPGETKYQGSKLLPAKTLDLKRIEEPTIQEPVQAPRMASENGEALIAPSVDREDPSLRPSDQSSEKKVVIEPEENLDRAEALEFDEETEQAGSAEHGS